MTQMLDRAAHGVNRVTLIGRLGRAPEMRYTPTGKPVSSFSVVTTFAWISSSGERQEETDWFNIVVWGNLAEDCKRALKKGQQVYVEGRMKNRRWQDVGDVAHSRAEVIAQEVVPLSLGNQ